MFIIIVTSIIAFIFGLFICVLLYKYKKSTPIDNIKNALLSLALAKVYKNKIDNGPIYTGITGKLPPFSGDTMTNAYYSYLSNPYESLFITKHMINKYKHIQNFMLNEFNSNEKAYNFFKSYINIISKK